MSSRTIGTHVTWQRHNLLAEQRQALGGLPGGGVQRDVQDSAADVEIALDVEDGIGQEPAGAPLALLVDTGQRGSDAIRALDLRGNFRHRESVDVADRGGHGRLAAPDSGNETFIVRGPGRVQQPALLLPGGPGNRRGGRRPVLGARHRHGPVNAAGLKILLVDGWPLKEFEGHQARIALGVAAQRDGDLDRGALVPHGRRHPNGAGDALGARAVHGNGDLRLGARIQGSSGAGKRDFSVGGLKQEVDGLVAGVGDGQSFGDLIAGIRGEGERLGRNLNSAGCQCQGGHRDGEQPKYLHGETQP